MIHLLCINFRIEAKPEAIAHWIDGLKVPYEWQDIPEASFDRLLVIRCEDAEELAEAMKTIPDRSLMTAFGFSRPKEAHDADEV